MNETVVLAALLVGVVLCAAAAIVLLIMTSRDADAWDELAKRQPITIHPLAWRHPSTEPNVNPHLRLVHDPRPFDFEQDGAA